MDSKLPGTSLLPRRVRTIALFIIVLGLLAEGGARLVGLGHPVIYAMDPDCGYLPAPNQNVNRFFRLNHINAFSMRSADISAQKPPGVYRVMFVGDSVTYGTTYVDQADIFTSILQVELPGLLHRPVEVLNASAGAWAPGNEAAFVRSRGTFGSDLVVFVLNTGDLNQPFNRQPLTLAGGYPENDPPLALWEVWVRYVKPRLSGGGIVDAGSRAGDAPAETIYSAGILESLQSARERCLTNHARFAVVYVPSTGPGWAGAAYVTGLDVLKNWALDRGVPLLSAGPALQGAAPALIYFDGIHLRPKGDAIIANLIEKNWPMLAGADSPGFHR